MAANPVIVACPAGTWVLAAENVLVGVIYRRSAIPGMYVRTDRVTGDAAPTDNSEVVPAFDREGESVISYDAPVDVYIKALNVAGEVRVDAGSSGDDLVYKGPIPGNISMQQDEYYFLLEQAFTQSQRFSFGSAEVKWFLIDPTNYTPDPARQIQNRIIFRLPGIVAEAGPIHIDFYGNPVLGTAVATPLTLPSFNRVSGSALTAQLELSSLDVAPTTSLGDPISQLLVPATATGVGNRSGDSLVESLPFSIGLAQPLLMVLTNTNGADTDVAVRHGWFEI